VAAAWCAAGAAAALGSSACGGNRRLKEEIARADSAGFAAAMRSSNQPAPPADAVKGPSSASPAGPADLEGFKQLREIAGAGFTSLMLDDKAMAGKLALSERSFGATAAAAGAERYFMALEHIESGALAGCCGVKATIGETPPFFNFRIITEAQSSAPVNRRFDMRVLIGVNDFTGCSEVGSLFVLPFYHNRVIGKKMVEYAAMMAKERGVKTLVALSTQSFGFFTNVSGFEEADKSILPETRLKAYEDSGRNAKVLTKQLA
jgi:GNAT superfamily N-acetyltransferase